MNYLYDLLFNVAACNCNLKSIVLNGGVSLLRLVVFGSPESIVIIVAMIYTIIRLYVCLSICRYIFMNNS